ncbi:hypothetical protein LC605_33000 [Nostoc sp. CHAB 5836]|uniref:hypothetical protein n=1 Tax=Nostoc sp. CHAB 5836 TaxID=2780404 RepID=UPI001E567FDB|nr:hypothetical protein [Nostoc sp. CHAB 5836]MCC5619750.1 hypothetical protein [Nostoc sp. CHAB 5836]
MMNLKTIIICSLEKWSAYLRRTVLVRSQKTIDHPNNRLRGNSIRRYNSSTTRIMPKILIL